MNRVTRDQQIVDQLRWWQETDVATFNFAIELAHDPDTRDRPDQRTRLRQFGFTDVNGHMTRITREMILKYTTGMPPTVVIFDPPTE